MQEFLKQLNKAYFWDIDPGHLDAVKSKRLIIERVMNYGNLYEIQLIKNHYGENEIKKIIFNSGLISEDSGIELEIFSVRNMI